MKPEKDKLSLIAPTWILWMQIAQPETKNSSVKLIYLSSHPSSFMLQSASCGYIAYRKWRSNTPLFLHSTEQVKEVHEDHCHSIQHIRCSVSFLFLCMFVVTRKKNSQEHEEFLCQCGIWQEIFQIQECNIKNVLCWGKRLRIFQCVVCPSGWTVKTIK